MECQFWILKKEKEEKFLATVAPIAVTNVTWNHVLFLFLGNRFLSNRSLNSVTSQTDKIVISLPIFFVMSKVNLEAMVMKINVLMTNPNAHSLLLSLFHKKVEPTYCSFVSKSMDRLNKICQENLPKCYQLALDLKVWVGLYHTESSTNMEGWRLGQPDSWLLDTYYFTKAKQMNSASTHPAPSFFWMKYLSCGSPGEASSSENKRYKLPSNDTTVFHVHKYQCLSI